MWLSVFRAPLRSLRRHRGFAALNVSGLALGLACVVLIALFVRDELRYDAFHARADRIVRVDADVTSAGQTDLQTRSQGLLGPALAASLPEVERTVRLLPAEPVLRVGAELFEPGQIYYADPEVLDVFTFPLLAGDAATALAAPGRIVLDASTARRLFGRTDVVGETVEAGEQTLTVSGVMADVPRQSHLRLCGLASLATLGDPGWFYQNWSSFNFLTYALLRQGASLDAFRARLPAFAEAVAGDEMRASGSRLAFRATPLADLYLRSDRAAGDAQGSLQSLSVLSLVALFVLLIAGVNFTNLATARSLDRAREVGVRKTLGASRWSLSAQFLLEAVVLCGLALVVALGLAWLALPAFSELTGRALRLADLGPWALGLPVLAVAVGLAAGAYPALVLSGFRPAEVLKGRFASGRRGAGLRQGLVVLQFGVSIALIAATVVVLSQLRYMQTQDLGLDLGGGETQLLVLPVGDSEALATSLDDAKRRLLGVAGVEGVASSISVPTGGQPGAGGELERPDGAVRPFEVTMYLVDTSFVEVYGLEVVAGAAPGAATLADSSVAYVLNETAVREAGYADPAAALGREAAFWGFGGTVTGVVRDFHTEGLQARIEPLALVATPDYQSVLTLRVQTAALPRTLAAVGGLWAELAPSRPFSYSFLDEDFGAQYVAERRFGRLFGVLAALAIGIACVGLLGLAAYETAVRTKEIGVRRVLGATVGQIVVLLSRNVVALVGAGGVLGVPVVVWGMSRWLDGFAYRISLGWAPFALAAAVVLAVAVVTVGGHALRAALADPVRTLRAE